MGDNSNPPSARTWAMSGMLSLSPPAKTCRTHASSALVSIPVRACNASPPPTDWATSAPFCPTWNVVVRILPNNNVSAARLVLVPSTKLVGAATPCLLLSRGAGAATRKANSVEGFLAKAQALRCAPGASLRPSKVRVSGLRTVAPAPVAGLPPFSLFPPPPGERGPPMST
ncbi:unnamed protein product [Ectocarpus fasciculatus]